MERPVVKEEKLKGKEGEKLEQEIIKEVTGNYLRLSGSGGETIADRMFMYQDIPGFLPMEATWINGEKQYIYDISGKITCEKYFSEASFDISIITHIIEQILELPKKLNQFLLDGSGAVIHEAYLYYDVRTKEIAAVYYPDSAYQGIKAIGGFLEFLMKQADRTEQQTMFFIYGLHRLTKEEGTTGRQLKLYMEEQQVSRREAGQADAGEPVQTAGGQEVMPPEREGKTKKGPGGKNTRYTRYILPGILIAAGLLIPALLCYNGCFNSPVSGEFDKTLAVGAALFFVGITGFGAWKLLSDKKGEILWEEEPESPPKVCLIPCQGKEEPLPISYFPFLLGSERNRADGVVTAQGVSPVHAGILLEAGHIMVMDEESEEGTFYNDQRLAAWQKIRLEDGDMLRFGEGEYVVEITYDG